MDEKIKELEELLIAQKMPGNWDFDPYMHGMTNGMILFLSILKNETPEFLDPPKNWVGDEFCWIPIDKELPKEETHVVCYCPGVDGHAPGRDWMDSDYCIGEHISGYWKRVDNQNIKPTHWTPIPKDPGTLIKKVFFEGNTPNEVH